MTFVIKADSTFEAENIDDAFKKLANYFISMTLDNEESNDELFFDSGEITIHPLGKNKSE